MKKSINKKCFKVIVYIVIFLFFGSITVFSQECGDVNNNGSTNINDALFIAQYYVGFEIEVFITSVADVNSDGSINIIDALLVARYYVGLIKELSCEVYTPDPTPDSTATPTPELLAGYWYSNTQIDISVNSSQYTYDHSKREWEGEVSLTGELDVAFSSEFLVSLGSGMPGTDFYYSLRSEENVYPYYLVAIVFNDHAHYHLSRIQIRVQEYEDAEYTYYNSGYLMDSNPDVLIFDNYMVVLLITFDNITLDANLNRQKTILLTENMVQTIAYPDPDILGGFKISDSRFIFNGVIQGDIGISIDAPYHLEDNVLSITSYIISSYFEPSPTFEPTGTPVPTETPEPNETPKPTPEPTPNNAPYQNTISFELKYTDEDELYLERIIDPPSEEDIIYNCDIEDNNLESWEYKPYFTLTTFTPTPQPTETPEPTAEPTPTPVDNGIKWEHFALTEFVYPFDSEWTSIVQNVFGSEYRVADWQDLVNYFGAGGNPLDIFNGLNLLDYNSSAAVTRNGGQYPYTSRTRAYYAIRHEHDKPNNFAHFSDIDDNLITLAAGDNSQYIMAINITITTPSPIPTPTYEPTPEPTPDTIGWP